MTDILHAQAKSRPFAAWIGHRDEDWMRLWPIHSEQHGPPRSIMPHSTEMEMVMASIVETSLWMVLIVMERGSTSMTSMTNTTLMKASNHKSVNWYQPMTSAYDDDAEGVGHHDDDVECSHECVDASHTPIHHSNDHIHSAQECERNRDSGSVSTTFRYADEMAMGMVMRIGAYDVIAINGVSIYLLHQRCHQTIRNVLTQ